MGAMTDPYLEQFFADDPRSQYERMRAGDLYVAEDPELGERSGRAMRLADAYQRAFIADPGSAGELLRALVGTLGEGAMIRPPLFVDYGENIHLGARCFLNNGCTLLDVAEIRIGDDTLIGPNVQILTPTHPVAPEPRRHKLEAAEPITIGSNVWIGGGATICPGVTIGDNSVIGAGAVVTRDIPANVVAVGNPARVIRERIDEE